MSSVIRLGSSGQQSAVVPWDDSRDSSNPGSGIVAKARAVVAQKGHGDMQSTAKPPKDNWNFGPFSGPTRDGNPGGLTRPGVGSTSFGEG